MLHMEKTIFEEISDAYPTLTETEIRNMLAAFLFTGDDVFKLISALSGGERGRVSLAKLMLSEANFLILDEPTNHLDYGNQLRALSMVRALVKRGFGVIMTSHNPDHVLLLGGQVGILGNDGRFLVGNAEEVMTEERLRALYRSDLYLTYVERVGRKVCIPGRLKSDE